MDCERLSERLDERLKKIKESGSCGSFVDLRYICIYIHFFSSTGIAFYIPEGLQQVNNSYLIDPINLAEREKLQKIQRSLTAIFETSLEDSFERCYFASSTAGAKEYQRLTELAAKFNLSIDKVKEIDLAFKSKSKDLLNCQKQLNKSIRFSKLKNNRVRKKLLKHQLQVLTSVNLILVQIVTDFWWYLSSKQKSCLEEFAIALASSGPEIQQISILGKKRSFRLLSPFKRILFQYFESSTVLINAIVNTDDTDEDFFAKELPLSVEFLDLISDDVFKNYSELVPYTEEMDLELDEVLKKEK